MHFDEIQNLAIAILAGLLVAALIVIFIPQLPQAELNSLYVNIHYLIFAMFVGTLPAMRYESTAARSNLVSVFLITTSISSVVGFAIQSMLPQNTVIYTGVFFLATLGLSGGSYLDLLSKNTLFKTILGHAALIYSFSITIIGVFTIRAINVGSIVLLGTITAAFISATIGIKQEL